MLKMNTIFFQKGGGGSNGVGCLDIGQLRLNSFCFGGFLHIIQLKAHYLKKQDKYSFASSGFDNLHQT